MSNAEKKSGKASIDMLPLLRERNRSLTTFRRGVSVLRDTTGRLESLSMLLMVAFHGASRTAILQERTQLCRTTTTTVVDSYRKHMFLFNVNFKCISYH